jgi:hypothetical protein
MAKKKKNHRKDTRGYGQAAQSSNTAKPPTTVSAPVVTSTTHDGLKNLLGQMQDTSISSTSTTPSTAMMMESSSDRFLSKLTTVVDRLVELGFTPAQVEEAVVALGYESSTLETALDWLCLHVHTLELPTLFTDGRIRDSLSTITTVESLTVLKLVAPPKTTTTTTTNLEEQKKRLPLVLESSTTQATTKKEEEQAQKEQDEAAERKNWLLQQYQYEEEAEAEAEEEELMMRKAAADVSQPSEEPRIPKKVPPQDSPTAVVNDSNQTSPSTPNLYLSPEEEYLMEQEQELKALEADANNDANNYMRTKHEIKQLKNEGKKKRQQVQGIRKNIQRTKAKEQKALLEEEQAKQQQQEITTPVNPIVLEEEEEEGKDKEDDGGAIFGMFEEEEATDVEASTPASASSIQLVLLDYSIPKNWTGSTPQKFLDDVCRKQKLGRPKYTKLPRNAGYKLVATLLRKQPSQTWEAYESDFSKDSSLQDYLAIQALYAMDPGVPLYRMFPPAFRDLWLSWINEIELAQTQQQQELAAAKQERMDHLLSLILANNTTNSSSSINQPSQVSTEKSSKKPDNTSTDEPIVHDNWDDEDTDEVRPTTNTKQPSVLARQLQKSFRKRQSSPDYQKMVQVRSALPMTSFRDQVLETVRDHPVTILCAETGAGKTTQCPQYLLEQALGEGYGDTINILCTQPRRVAATSVAERVAEELCDRLGELVGYQIRMEAKRSARTKLLFCTTGIILRRLQEDRTLQGVTHVIVDEVHERQQQTDVLLIGLRQLLQTSRPDLKVILVSLLLFVTILWKNAMCFKFFCHVSRLLPFDRCLPPWIRSCFAPSSKVLLCSVCLDGPFPCPITIWRI